MRRHPKRGPLPAAVAACALLIAWPAGFGSATPPVEAAPSDRSAATTGDVHDTGWQLSPGGAELTGLNPATSITVDVPAGWVPSGAGTLRVEYSIAAGASGSLSIFANGNYITDIEVEHAGPVVELDIASEHFSVGVNRIDIVSSIALTSDGSCPRPGHAGRRITISEASELEIPLATTDIEFSELIDAMQSVGTASRRLDLHVVGPLRSNSLTGAADVVAAISDDAHTPVDVTLTRHTSAGFSLDTFDPAVPSIVIGNRFDLALDPGSNEGGYLAVTRSSNGRPVLVLSGGDAGEIAGVANVVSDPAELAKLNTVGAATIDNVLGLAPAEPAPTATEVTFTLADLGYPTRTLDGPGRDTTTYGFDIDIDQIPEFASVHVDATRSGDSTLNGVGLVVNGERIGVATFDANGTTTQSVVTVPAAVLRPGRNLVRLEADFDEPIDSCAGLSSLESIDISNTSTIELGPPSASVTLDLDDLPYTFRSPGDSAGLTVLLPDDPTDAQLESALLIADVLATSGSAARLTLRADFDPIADEHVVIIGDRDVDFIAGLVDVPPSPQTVSEGDEAPPLGSILLTQRSDAPGRLALILGGDDDETALLALRAIIDIDVRSDLSGSSATLLDTPSGIDVLAGANTTIAFPTEPASLNEPIADNATLETRDVDRRESLVSIEQTGSTGPDDSDTSIAMLAIGLAAGAALIAAAAFGWRSRRSSPTA